MNKRQKKVFGIIIGILFLASCCMECYRVSGGLAIGSFGLMALLLGWLNFDAVGLVWLANPLFLLSLILFLFSKKIKLALFLSAIACYLSLYFMQIEEIIKDEAGHVGEITDYLLGYWLWVSANVTLVLTLIVQNIMSLLNAKHN